MIRDAPAIPAPDPVRPGLKFVQPPPQQMSWNSPTTFPPARTVVLGVTLTIRLRDDLSYVRVAKLWNDAAETGKGSDVFRFPNDPGAYFLSSRWIIFRDKLANFLQIGNSGLGPNQGCHYFLSAGAYPLGHIRAAFTGPANNSKRCRTTLMCSSLSLPTKRGNRKNRPKLPNPDR